MAFVIRFAARQRPERASLPLLHCRKVLDKCGHITADQSGLAMLGSALNLLVWLGKNAASFCTSRLNAACRMVFPAHASLHNRAGIFGMLWCNRLHGCWFATGKN